MNLRGFAFGLVVFASLPLEASDSGSRAEYGDDTIWERVRGSGERKIRLVVARLRAKIARGRALSQAERAAFEASIEKGLLRRNVGEGLLLLDAENRGEPARGLEKIGPEGLAREGFEDAEKRKLARLFAKSKEIVLARAFYESLERRSFGSEEWGMLELERISLDFFESGVSRETGTMPPSGGETIVLSPFGEMFEAAFGARARPPRKTTLTSERSNELLSLLENASANGRGEASRLRPIFAPLVDEILGAALLEAVERSLAKQRYESIVAEFPELESVYRERIEWLAR